MKMSDFAKENYKREGVLVNINPFNKPVAQELRVMLGYEAIIESDINQLKEAIEGIDGIILGERTISFPDPVYINKILNDEYNCKNKEALNVLLYDGEKTTKLVKNDKKGKFLINGVFLYKI